MNIIIRYDGNERQNNNRERKWRKEKKQHDTKVFSRRHMHFDELGRREKLKIIKSLSFFKRKRVNGGSEILIQISMEWFFLIR